MLQETMTKKQKKRANYIYAEGRLDELLNSHQEIFCIIRHVSQSGMTRHISFFIIDNRDNKPLFLDIDQINLIRVWWFMVVEWIWLSRSSIIYKNK